MREQLNALSLDTVSLVSSNYIKTTVLLHSQCVFLLFTIIEYICIHSYNFLYTLSSNKSIY